MHTLCKTQKEAKIKGDKFYFTGKPCKHGHISKRYTSYRRCHECSIQYPINNKTECNKYKSKYYLNNKTECINRSTEYNKNNIKKRRIINSKYSRHNRAKRNEILARYRASKLNRTPLWLSESDKREIELIYKIAARVSKETGVPHHVDHEIPLQGELVSGLHISDNLQLLTASENISKGNSFAIN